MRVSRISGLRMWVDRHGWGGCFVVLAVFVFVRRWSALLFGDAQSSKRMESV
jgi:hypothetical protein